ncbi:hypothetical protein [Nocardia terpenica]|uniref:Uncharacterized protein n=1 Tax=Nocardia terpenica TaxID=455432 RepID=A0A164M608_9NOCA|nr:hypothetical protein [Nocardia terpenica]KZM73070.1 hypothetical protein AWN90_30600 [Nocardia terpenica]NQE91973.1 hypothetical protein [Nocardia terpenica]
MRIEIRDPQRVQRLRAIVAAGVITAVAAPTSAETAPPTVNPGAPDPEDPTPKPFAPAFTIPGVVAK